MAPSGAQPQEPSALDADAAASAFLRPAGAFRRDPGGQLDPGFRTAMRLMRITLANEHHMAQFGTHSVPNRSLSVRLCRLLGLHVATASRLDTGKASVTWTDMAQPPRSRLRRKPRDPRRTSNRGHPPLHVGTEGGDRSSRLGLFGDYLNPEPGLVADVQRLSHDHGEETDGEEPKEDTLCLTTQSPRRGAELRNRPSARGAPNRSSPWRSRARRFRRWWARCLTLASRSSVSAARWQVQTQEA